MRLRRLTIELYRKTTHSNNTTIAPKIIYRKFIFFDLKIKNSEVVHARSDDFFPEKKFDSLWEEDGRLMIILAPLDILSEIKIGDKKLDKSNRLCFVSERLNIQLKSDEAIQSLKKAIEIDNKNSTAFALLGGILNEQNSSECIKYYEKSIAINDRCYLAYRGLGNYYLKNKQYDKAGQYYTKAIEINTTRFGPIYKNRGLVRLEQKKTIEAKQDFENYLKYTPNAKDKQSILQALREL